MKCPYFTLAMLCIFTVACINSNPLPRVSIITSVFKDYQFRKRFLENITKQTIFNECELLLIDATPAEISGLLNNLDPLITEYMQKYPNIKYVKLSFDPGVYGIWNLGVLLAQAPYLTNANLDDLRYADCLEKQAIYLDEHAHISLVYADFKYSDDPKSDIDNCHIVAHVNHAPVIDFKKSLYMCIPGPQPMWRKSVHNEVGLFNQGFLYSGDWEFWNRMVKKGLIFGQMEGYSGVYYYNPEGLSTNQNPEKVDRRNQENQYVVNQYGSMWHGQE